MDDDVTETNAAVEEFARLTGSSAGDQLSQTLLDIANALGNFRDRLLERGFTKTAANEMSSLWFHAFVWSDNDDE